MIKKIVLENFMSHAHTVIEPADGLTLLVGPNNCGKSAIVEALRAVCENTPTDFMVRHGAKEAIVTLETEDGHVISWHRRKRTAAYVIDGVRNDRPDADCLAKVHRLLKLPKVKAAESGDEFDVHFGDQKSPIFLLNETGTRAATFFASSSDAERLLQMQRIHRNKVADDKKEEQRRSSALAALDAKLLTLLPLDQVQSRLAEVELRHADLKDGIVRTDRLEQLHLCLMRTRRRVWRHTAEQEAVGPLAAPPALDDEQAIDRLIKRCKSALRRRDIATRQAAAMANVESPPSLADVPALERLCRQRRTLERRVAHLSATNDRLSPLAQPPASADLSALTLRIATLRRQIAVRDRAAARRDRLQQIAEPPLLADTKPAADFLMRLRTARSTIAHRQATLNAAMDQLANAQRAIEVWAQQNPTCPVCNGVIDASALLSSRGEHAHV